MDGALRVYLYLRELRFGPNFRRNRTFARYWPDFHAYAVRQTGTFFRDGKRFVHRGNIEKKVATNGFLGFGEWSIRDDSLFSRNDFPLALERISGDGRTLVGQPLEPSHPIVCDLLQFFRRETFAQVRAAK